MQVLGLNWDLLPTIVFVHCNVAALNQTLSAVSFSVATLKTYRILLFFSLVAMLLLMTSYGGDT